MIRSPLPFLLCAIIGSQALLADDLLPTPPSSQSPAPSQPGASQPGASQPGASQQLVAEARAACDTDIQKLCPGVQPGGGRIFACLKQHKDQVSDSCKHAVIKATNGPN